MTIESLGDMPGVDKSFPQPSVVAVIVDAGVAHKGMPRLLALFNRLRRGRPLDGARRDAVLAELICATAHDLLRVQGCPLFCEPICNRIDERRHRIRIPTITGAHALTRTLLVGLVRVANAALAGNPTAEAERDLEELLRLIRPLAPKGRNTLPLLKAANARGIPWDRVAGNVYRFGQGARSRWFDSSISDHTPSISVGLAKDKQAAASVLRSHHLPVPDHVLVHSEAKALAAARVLGFPVVVKPANLDRGVGVMSGLRDNDSVAKAYRAAVVHSKAILVEKHFEGRDHRLHVFEGVVYKVRHRIPGGVTGDGRSTIQQLLTQLNADPARGPRGSNANMVAIDMDEEALDLIVEQGFEPTSVPPDGQFIQLRRIANVSAGGVSHPVPLENVHPDNLDLARRAVEALRLDIAAVDLLIPDIGRSWLDVGAAICEVNAQPQFGADAPEWIFDRIFPDKGRIPIAVILGNPLDMDWADVLRRRLQAAGKRLGFCSPLGVWIGDQRIATASPLKVYEGAALLSANPAVDALLLVADDSLLQLGLPSTRVDALAVTGASSSARLPQLAAMLSEHSRQVLGVPGADPAAWRECRARCVDCGTLDISDMADRLFELLSGQESGPADRS